MYFVVNQSQYEILFTVQNILIQNALAAENH